MSQRRERGIFRENGEPGEEAVSCYIWLKGWGGRGIFLEKLDFLVCGSSLRGRGANLPSWWGHQGAEFLRWGKDLFERYGRDFKGGWKGKLYRYELYIYIMYCIFMSIYKYIYARARVCIICIPNIQ